MSYNYQVLLGFWGRVEFPLESYENKYFVKFDAPEALKAYVTGLTLLAANIDMEFTNKAVTTSVPLVGVPGWRVETADGGIPLYHLQWRIVKWECSKSNDKVGQNWCDVDAATGFITMRSVTYDTEDVNALWTCTVEVDLLAIDGIKPIVTRSFTINASWPTAGSSLPTTILQYYQKKTILFDETIRLGVAAHGGHDQQGWGVTYWEIPSVSKKYLRFRGKLNGDGTAKDDSRSVLIQARQQATPPHEPAVVIAHYFPGYATGRFEIEIISDMIQMSDNCIEAAYVGNSLSTAQLYLLSNCGNQWFNNDLNNARDLDAVMVSAVIHNSFSVGYPITGSGDAPTTVTGMDLSHLEYRLVDSNYVPIKLQSPMYLTLKVDAADDPVKDISMWRGKLPKDAPTPEQKAQMELQQAQAQQQEMIQKQKMEGLTDLLARALNRAADQQAETEQVEQAVEPIVQEQPQPEQPMQEMVEQNQAERDSWMAGNFW
jgi:hypothetical protein